MRQNSGGSRRGDRSDVKQVIGLVRSGQARVRSCDKIATRDFHPA
jgi:hypothetical protein